jgi:hypothetical protein
MEAKEVRVPYFSFFYYRVVFLMSAINAADRDDKPTKHGPGKSQVRRPNLPPTENRGAAHEDDTQLNRFPSYHSGPKANVPSAHLGAIEIR